MRHALTLATACFEVLAAWAARCALYRTPSDLVQATHLPVIAYRTAGLWECTQGLPLS